MRKTVSENDLIKNSCKIDCRWDNEQKHWIIKINHITDEIAFSAVKVTVEGFDNFREAVDEAMKLFKRNIRNGIKENQVVKMKFTADDIWPAVIYETV